MATDTEADKRSTVHHEDVLKEDVLDADVVIDPEAEKMLLRKLDLRVVPPLFLMFLFAFLDRTNIGMFLGFYLQ